MMLNAMQVQSQHPIESEQMNVNFECCWPFHSTNYSTHYSVVDLPTDKGYQGRARQRCQTHYKRCLSASVPASRAQAYPHSLRLGRPKPSSPNHSCTVVTTSVESPGAACPPGTVPPC